MSTLSTEQPTAADDLVIPLGTRADGTPIRISQSRESNVSIFGGAGSGKSVLLSQIIRAVARQGAAVIVADAVGDPDLRKLAPGLVQYSAGCDAALHRTVKYTLDELESRRRHPDEKWAPVLLVLHEVAGWLWDLDRKGTDASAAAEVTLARINRVAAMGREYGVHLLTVGQLAAPEAMWGGRWKSNVSTTVALGPVDELNLRSLFLPREHARVRALSSQISRGARGWGIVQDVGGEVELFRTAYAPADGTEAMHAPKQQRFGWKFPTGDEEGSDGSWPTWTPVSNPSSDSLPVIPLGDPDAAVFDPTSKSFRPGTKPLSIVHTATN
ncbi:type IV secretory system conjugative DNA transfer family protein [Mycobacteroides abscessus]|uniref:type IV secretory system conjugative DNA transfer family protein n=1 Tax=Mycobacteroides abscessus TaxID=36809 RepID=UPI000E694D74|nr:type IV secretion system DNA-binding domain-containing protein [Mycobacteroides abscessus]RIS02774.1 hypothetical protein D2E45_12395 [Mycobacteroides abscessus]